MVKLSKSICAVMGNKQKSKQTVVIIVIRALGQTVTRCLETIPHYHSLYTYACQLTLLQTFHIYTSESKFILASGLYIK